MHQSRNLRLTFVLTHCPYLISACQLAGEFLEAPQYPPAGSFSVAVGDFQRRRQAGLW